MGKIVSMLMIADAAKPSRKMWAATRTRHYRIIFTEFPLQ